MPLLIASVGTPTAHEPARKSEMDVSGLMILLTWVSFGLAAVILHRIAWKPMLRALDRRETMIRKSVDDAERARKTVEQAAERQTAMLAEADGKARALLEEARKTAAAMATGIEAEARTEARRLVAEAAAEIENQRRRAVESLRDDAARMATDLAERILKERAAGADGPAFTERAVHDLEGHGHV